ncbi:FtsX-like permease family protein [Rhodococcoides fascians A21d2]|uniref:FtsX-like permease family protein n=1 Tax=Rhodococcoides fascians TaxID=1828 RepID=UPI00056555D3|nr:FtsX-like permease family protein [Rhodococcus fascians]QII01446.1 FtsX-like permease family protein [Rhodococcus fascians A21d2]
MLHYAIHSLRFSRERYLPTVVVLFGGIALVSAFVGLFASSVDASSADDRWFLVLFPAILGGWILAIALFAVSSTVGVVSQSRSVEFDILRRVGASDRQMRLLVTIEITLVAAAVSVPATASGIGLGRVVLGRLHSIGIVDDSTGYAPGVTLPILAALVLSAASGVAAQYGSIRTKVRRASRTRRRRGVAVGFVMVGLASSTAAFAVDPNGAAATATAGPGTVFIAIGLGLCAEETLTATCRLLAVPLAALGAGGHLASINAVRTQGVRPIVTFLTLFIGVTVGTLSMQGIENASGATGPQGQLMASINYAVVGVVAAFMAIAAINTSVAALGHRRGEFASMSLIGATPTQTRRMLSIESALAVVTAGWVGIVGAAIAVAPFAYVKLGNPVAAESPLLAIGVLTVAAVVTSVVTTTVGRRVIAAASPA